MSKRTSKRASALAFWIFLILLIIALAVTSILVRERVQTGGAANASSEASGGIDGVHDGGTGGSDADTGTGDDSEDGEDSQDDGSDDVGAPIDAVNAADALGQARVKLESMVRSNHRLSPLFLRLGFHDCIGGCDGCVDLDHVDNRGLSQPVNELRPVVEEFATAGVTRADIWSLAAIVGADEAQGRERIDFDFATYGRLNCEDTNDVCRNELNEEVPCDETHGPHRAVPSPDLTTHALLTFFEEEFNFSMEETVAIMGAHTLGKLERENSGFRGNDGWVRREDILDNEYYEGLVGGNSADDPIAELFDAPNWNQRMVDNSDIVDIPDRYQWSRGGRGRGRRRLGGRGRGGGRGGRNDDEIMLNIDIALVRDFEGEIDHSTGEVSCEFERNDNDAVGSRVCPAAHTLPQMAMYRHDNTIWLQDFQAALTKMLMTGYTITTGCEDSVCKLTNDNLFFGGI